MYKANQTIYLYVGAYTSQEVTIWLWICKDRSCPLKRCGRTWERFDAASCSSQAKCAKLLQVSLPPSSLPLTIGILIKQIHRLVL